MPGTEGACLCLQAEYPCWNREAQCVCRRPQIFRAFLCPSLGFMTATPAPTPTAMSLLIPWICSLVTWYYSSATVIEQTLVKWLSPPIKASLVQRQGLCSYSLTCSENTVSIELMRGTEPLEEILYESPEAPHWKGGSWGKALACMAEGPWKRNG